MPLGPIELIVVKFPGSQFTGGLIPALRELVERETIRIVDILLVRKDAQGAVNLFEISDLVGDEYTIFDPIVSEVAGLLTEDDVQDLTHGLENNSHAALMLFENTWATRFRDAVLDAKGELVLSERIPHAVITELIEARVQLTA